MILVISTFTFGCGETQEEKFSKLEKQYSELFITKGKELTEISKSNLSDKEIWEKDEEIVKNIKKEAENILKEMEKTSKGNEKLEKKTFIYKKRYNYTIQETNKLLNELYQKVRNNKG